MADIRVRVDADDAERRLRALALGLSDLRNFWPLVVPIATGWWKQQFDSEGRYGSGGWSPLAPSTVLYKSLAGLRPQILQATGAMKQAASRPSRQASARSLTLTIDDPKIGFHQTGTSRMPARPVILETLPFAAERELQDAADSYVRDLLDRF